MLNEIKLKIQSNSKDAEIFSIFIIRDFQYMGLKMKSHFNIQDYCKQKYGTIIKERITYKLSSMCVKIPPNSLHINIMTGKIQV